MGFPTLLTLCEKIQAEEARTNEILGMGKVVYGSDADFELIKLAQSMNRDAMELSAIPATTLKELAAKASAHSAFEYDLMTLAASISKDVVRLAG